MLFKPGDLVVLKWSKAGTLKGKTYRVVGEVPGNHTPFASSYTNKIRCARPSGGQTDIYEYRLHTLSEELDCAKARISQAEDTLNRERYLYNEMVKEIEEVKRSFPQV